MIKFRYWLSVELLRLAVAVLPDKASQHALRMGIMVGMEMLANAVEDSNES